MDKNTLYIVLYRIWKETVLTVTNAVLISFSEEMVGLFGFLFVYVGHF